MRSATQVVVGATMLAMVQGQAIITSAKGDSGESVTFNVQVGNPDDANFMSNAEMTANVVNECGRTFLGGNIDIGEAEELLLEGAGMTQVTAGGIVTMTIDQINEDGVGPFVCDLDPQGNTLGAAGQTPLETTEEEADGITTVKVTLPGDLACIGSSAGNVCTIRCRNPKDFGGCVGIQQTDTTPLPADNDPANIAIAAKPEAVDAQIKENQKDLPAAIKGNEAAATPADQGVKIAEAIFAANPDIKAAVDEELKSADGGNTPAKAAGNNDKADDKAADDNNDDKGADGNNDGNNDDKAADDNNNDDKAADDNNNDDKAADDNNDDKPADDNKDAQQDQQDGQQNSKANTFSRFNLHGTGKRNEKRAARRTARARAEMLQRLFAEKRYVVVDMGAGHK